MMHRENFALIRALFIHEDRNYAVGKTQDAGVVSTQI
jgi:hypothetical protein